MGGQHNKIRAICNYPLQKVSRLGKLNSRLTLLPKSTLLYLVKIVLFREPEQTFMMFIGYSRPADLPDVSRKIGASFIEITQCSPARRSY